MPGAGDAGPSSATADDRAKPGGSGPSDAAGAFECCICLELAAEPVVTVCGHLFCWPCLYKWLRQQSECKLCPVCKAGVDEDKVIPLYGRGGGGQDPRKRPQQPIPSRPAGQRPEAQRQHAPAGAGVPPFFFDGGGGGFPAAQFGNFHLSAGFGLFPSLFGLQFQSFGGPPMHAGAGGVHGGAGAAGGQDPQAVTEQQQRQHLSRLLSVLASLVILCVLFF